MVCTGSIFTADKFFKKNKKKLLTKRKVISIISLAFWK